jgi:hypothetical protein
MDTLYKLTSGEGVSGRISAAALAGTGFSLFQILALTAVFGLVAALIWLTFSMVKSLAGSALWLRTRRAPHEKENIAENCGTKKFEARRESESVPSKRRLRPAMTPG